MSGETPYEYVYINSLSGGLNVVDSVLSLNDNELSVAYNCTLTTRGQVKKRNGYYEDSAHEISGANVVGIKSGYRFYYGTSATTVVQSNDIPNKMYSYSFTAGYTEITGGTDINTNKMHYVDYKDWLFMFNGSQTHCWDGTGTKSDIAFETGDEYKECGTKIRCMEVCDDRLFIVFEDEPYSLYFTEYGGWDTDPATDILLPLVNYLNVPERSRDASGITGLKSFGLTDELLVFTENVTWVLLGVGATDYDLRKFTGEAGCINQDTIVETATGSICWIGNKKIFMTNGEQTVSIGDNISPIFTQIDMTDAFSVYDGDNDLVLFFYSAGVMVWNIGTTNPKEQPVFGWTMWNIPATAAIRYTSAADENQTIIAINGESKLYRLGGLSDDGEKILFKIKTKAFDMEAFAEKKTFRGIKTLQDCVTTTPFTITLDIDDGHKKDSKTMTLPYEGVSWGSSTWNGTVWNGASRINGSINTDVNMWGYEFAVCIQVEDLNPLTIHKIAVEVFPRNRDRVKL